MQLITDRTQADVERVKELSAKGYGNMTEAEQIEWLSGMKGAYNYTDLNRVESAMVALASVLGVQLWNPKTNWNMQDIPTNASMVRYLENLKRLHRACKGISSTPDTPETMNKLNYIIANNIEQILLDIETAIESYYMCGEVSCGEV